MTVTWSPNLAAFLLPLGLDS